MEHKLALDLMRPYKCKNAELQLECSEVAFVSLYVESDFKLPSSPKASIVHSRYIVTFSAWLVPWIQDDMKWFPDRNPKQTIEPIIGAFRAKSKLAIEFLLQMNATLRHAFDDSRTKLVLTDLHNVVDDIGLTKTRWRNICLRTLSVL